MIASPPSDLTSTQPGLVIALSERLSGGAGVEYTATLEKLVASTPNLAVLDLADLRREGMPGAWAGALERIRFERAIADRVIACLRAVDVHLTGGSFVVAVVAMLTEEAARRSTVAILPLLESAFRRVAFPRSIKPVIVGIHLLPQRWSALEAAGLFAWLKEFTRALDLSTRRTTPFRGYTIATVLGHSDVDFAGDGRYTSRSELEVATSAAEFTAASLRYRIVDEILASHRGRPRAPDFDTFGIASFLPAEEKLEQVASRGRVLWPVEPQSRPGEGRGVIRMVAGVEAAPVGWHRISVFPGIQPTRAWALQVAGSLRPTDLIGADVWRSHYLALSQEERRELHGISAAVDWPDPFESAQEVPALSEMGGPAL